MFSYKTTTTGANQTKGTGANNKVTRTKNHLNAIPVRTHMKNEADPISEIYSSWDQEWRVSAVTARLVVLFNDDDYMASTACTLERTFAMKHCRRVLEIPDYSDPRISAEGLKDMILQEFKG